METPANHLQELISDVENANKNEWITRVFENIEDLSRSQ